MSKDLKGLRLGKDPRPFDPWWKLRKLALREPEPTQEEFAKLLREAIETAGAPSEVLDYVENRVAGKIRRGQGRPTPPPHEKVFMALWQDLFLRMHEAAFRQQKIPNARQRALSAVAGKTIAPETLETRLKRALKGYRKHTLEDGQETLDAWVAEGLIRLDREHGYVFIESGPPGG